ncbi:MAG: MetQ/NlpA family ABC transporter substrate-binding protein [Ferrovibrionaceae bacterium]
MFASLRKTLAVALFAGAAFIQPAAADGTLKVGVTAGPHAQILEVAKTLAARNGLKINIVEFSDYIQPNAALAQGDLDVNIYQHRPFLDQQVKDRGYKIVAVADTVVFPMGIYSKKVKKLDELKAGARIAIPNDPTNGGRALLLLEKVGLIKLDPKAGLKAGPADVTDNPRKLKIVELEAAQLPRALDEVDAAAVNTNYALPAGLVPTRDAIAIETPESPYVNIIAVRQGDENKPDIKAFIQKTFQDSVVAAW